MSEEIKIPKLISGKISLKALSISSLSMIAETLKESGTDYQLLLLTSYGFIKGDYSEIATEDVMMTQSEGSDAFNVDVSYSHVLRNQTLSAYEENFGEDSAKTIDNGAIISLKNVSIYKENLDHPVISYNTFVIFADQILGYSLVPRELPQN